MRKRDLSVVVLLCCVVVWLLSACTEDCGCDDGDNCLPDGDGDGESDATDGDGVDGDVDFDVDAEPDTDLDGDLDAEGDTDAELDAGDGDLDGEIESDAEFEEEVEDVDPGYDQYYGSLRFETEATGFFRVEQIDGQWWMITPEGHPFFSNGLNVLNYTGTCTQDGVCHYRDNMDAIYDTREAWADDQVPRVPDWGWNTVGAWSDWRLFKTRKLPYTVKLTVATANYENGGPIDYFAPAFYERARSGLEATLLENVDDPWLIGYFTDNELHWGYDLYRGKHLMTEYMAMAADAPGKIRLVQMLRERYGSLHALSRDFEHTAESWDDLLVASELKPKETDGMLATRAAFSGLVAEAYFSTTDSIIRELDPNHMNLGVRFVSQLVPKAVIEVAGRYVDVMSINWYDLIDGLAAVLVGLDEEYLPVDNWLHEHYLAGGRPILVSEWGYRSKDGGVEMNTYPPIYPTLETSADRADAYEARMRGMLAREWFVGQHWFLFADQPPEGRFDGEDNNFGIVTEEDIPYDVLVERSTMMHAEIYRRLIGVGEVDGDADVD